MQQQKSQDVFLRPSFPGHLLEMSNAYGFHPPHDRHFRASVHVNLDVQKSSLAFLFCNYTPKMFHVKHSNQNIDKNR